VEKDSLTYVNGYDDPPIVAGAGTIGMEVRNIVLHVPNSCLCGAANIFCHTTDHRRCPRR
jgi:threonine dehydratase